MRILFAAYCLINDVNGNSLIGVYKRCLRLGLQMESRGHEVWIFCPNREGFRDDLTDIAEQRLHFLELPPKIVHHGTVRLRRAWCRMAFQQLKPDVVVAGEAPLSGTILETTLWAASAGMPLAILDNAYGPDFSRQFLEAHGPMADGVILTGPSSFHMTDPPPHYCGVPPYLEGAGSEAEAVLAGKAEDAPLIAVLGYDRKAEQLAAGLLKGLSVHPDFQAKPPVAVFFTPDPAACTRRLEECGVLRHCLSVLPPPAENLLSGILAKSRLVVGKCGFMQISESLALGTPFMGVHYLGCCPMFLIPENAREFVHAVYGKGTGVVEAGAAEVAAAVQLLQAERDAVRALHDGRFGALHRAAEFLEQLAGTPRERTPEECDAMAYQPELLHAALSPLHPGKPVEVRAIRTCRLRDEAWGQIDAVVCRYRAGGANRCSYMWGRVFRLAAEGRREVESLTGGGSGRKLIFHNADATILLEDMGEESLLPPLLV